MHMAIQKQEEMPVHSKRRAQIQDKAQVRALLFDEAPTAVPAEYSDYSNVLLAENAMEISENTGMNEHIIKRKKDNQLPFGLIYNLSPVMLKTLKTYIETNLANGFIWLSKFPASVPILFDRKLNESLCFCVDYWGFNNITIKNWYPLPMIGESLDRFSPAKRFTQLDLTIAYHWMKIHESNE